MSFKANGNYPTVLVQGWPGDRSCSLIYCGEKMKLTTSERIDRNKDELTDRNNDELFPTR